MLFWTNLRQQLKNELRSKSFVIILFVMAALLLGLIRCSQASDTPVSIDIGVVLEGESPYLPKIGDSLMGMDLPEINIEVIEGYTRDELKELVAGEKFEGIYIISDQLIDGIIKGKPRRTMDTYISPNFFMDKTMNAWIYSAVLIELSFEVSVQTTSEILLLNKEDIYDEMAETYNYHEKNHTFVGLKSSYFGGAAVEETGTELIYTRVVHGVIVIGILLANWAVVPKSIGLYEKTIVRLGKNKRRQLAISQFWVHLGISLLTGLVLFALLKIFAPTLTAPLTVELIALLLYAVVMGALGNLIALLLRTQNLVFSSSLFSFLVFLFLGGTIINPRELGKVLGSAAKILPSYYYSESTVSGSLTPLLPLVTGGILLVIIMIIVGQRERKQK